MSLTVVIALILACGNPTGPWGETHDPAAGSGSNAGPPPGFGSATFSFLVAESWPLDLVGSLSGTILGIDDMGAQSVALYPGDQRFVVSAADWPRVEGPADVTAACGLDSFTAKRFDTCSFHFTEMRRGYQDTYVSTWYLHGSFAAGKGGVTLVTASF